MLMVNYYVDAFKKFFDFKGKADRPAYWWFVLGNFVVALILGFVGLQMIYNWIALIPSIAILVRRIRDTGLSPWHALWLLLPVIGWIIVIVLAVLPTKGK